jgi:hypothetical protein
MEDFLNVLCTSDCLRCLFPRLNRERLPAVNPVRLNTANIQGEYCMDARVLGESYKRGICKIHGQIRGQATPPLFSELVKAQPVPEFDDLDGQVPSMVFYFAPPSAHTPIPSLKTIVVPYCADIFARRSMIFLAMAGSARRGVP